MLLIVDLQRSRLQYAGIFTIYFLISFLMPSSSIMHIVITIKAKVKEALLTVAILLFYILKNTTVTKGRTHFQYVLSYIFSGVK